MFSTGLDPEFKMFEDPIREKEILDIIQGDATQITKDFVINSMRYKKATNCDYLILGLYFDNDNDLEEINHFKTIIRDCVRSLKAENQTFIIKTYSGYDYDYFGNLDMKPPAYFPLEPKENNINRSWEDNNFSNLKSSHTHYPIKYSECTDFLIKNKGFIGSLSKLQLIECNPSFCIYKLKYTEDSDN